MTAARTQAVFSATASSYDPARAKLIPCFAEFYAAAVAALPATTRNVLDLGAGTGLLSAFIRERFSTACMHLVDNSEPMLQQARERFAGDARVSFQTADYTAMTLPQQYDAVVSALSIHHLPDEKKRMLFMQIHSTLRPGGVFINAEQILASTPALEEEARQEWLAQVRSLGATEQQVAESLLRQTEDRCATIADQLNWLRDAGFASVRCTFEQGRFAVLTGTRKT